MQYTNPIIPGFHPDPSVCRVGDDYYLVTSSFEYFPGVPLYHSRDLVNWTLKGHVLTRTSQLDLAGCGASGGIYAPTLRHHNGRFFMITTNVSGVGSFLVWTDDIEGPWSDPVAVDAPGIDPSLLFDDGRVYYTGNSGPDETQGIFGFEIDVTTGRRLSPRIRLWNGTGGAHPEGPHLYKIGGWYYLLISEGGTEHGHMLTIARSRAPLGPFEGCPRNPVLTNRSRLTDAKAIGHGDLVQTPEGAWWAVCLGIRPVGYPETHHLGRETFLVPVEWDQEGWPVLGTNGTVSLIMEVDRPGPVQAPASFRRDDFSAADLDPEWVFLRTPCRDASWGAAGGLVLKGNAASLDDQASPAFVGRRLAHFAFAARTELVFEPAVEGDEAGLTVLMNHRHHYEAAVAWHEGRRQVLFRRRIGSLWKVEASVDAPAGPVVLELLADRESFRFAFGPAGGPLLPLGAGETRYLSTEVGGAFTGAFVGLYATGRGRPGSSAARFAWFEYLPG